MPQTVLKIYIVPIISIFLLWAYLPQGPERTVEFLHSQFVFYHLISPLSFLREHFQHISNDLLCLIIFIEHNNRVYHNFLFSNMKHNHIKLNNNILVIVLTKLQLDA